MTLNKKQLIKTIIHGYLQVAISLWFIANYQYVWAFKKTSSRWEMG